MFEKVTPEQVGISSSDIKEYINMLENRHLSTHQIMMVRHGKVFYENYWKPFHKDYLHRMYSVSKSFVAIAIGFLKQEGKIDLDAPAISYLDESITKNANEYVKNQTIRNMLMMSTGKPTESISWFSQKPEDRLKHYFDESSRAGTPKIPGTLFEYDSPGTYVLGSIAEIVSGKPLIEYLREKCLDKIGFSKEAYFLTCPGGHSWCDSALLCKASDLAKAVMFMMNGGAWEGEQILDAEYAKEATSNLIDTNRAGHLLPSAYGYGYQIWRTRDNSFFFNGMGCQFGIAVPDKDIVFVINSDNQGHAHPHIPIIDGFFEMIANKASDTPLPENKKAYDELIKYSESLELFSYKSNLTKTVADEVSGKEFIMKENPMGITKMKFTFEGDEGKLDYSNAQGDKTIYFGINKNVFETFPQEGYSDGVATKFAPGNYYKCASSGMWTHERNLALLVQIIDKYFGRLNMRITFTEDGRLAVYMTKIAEDFLQEYEGYAEGVLA